MAHTTSRKPPHGSRRPDRSFMEAMLEKDAAAEPGDQFTRDVLAWQKAGAGKRGLPAVLAGLRPMVSKRKYDYPRAGMEVTQAELTRAAIKGLQRYQQGKGTTASTWAVSWMREAHRPLVRQATPLRVPDVRLQQAGRLQRAIRELEDSDGKARLIQPRDIALKMKTSEKMVRLLQKELQPVHVRSVEEVPHGRTEPPQERMFRLLGAELAPGDSSVLALMREGRTPAQSAKALKTSPASVSRARERIRRRLKELKGSER